MTGTATSMSDGTRRQSTTQQVVISAIGILIIGYCIAAPNFFHATTPPANSSAPLPPEAPDSKKEGSGPDVNVRRDGQAEHRAEQEIEPPSISEASRDPESEKTATPINTPPEAPSQLPPPPAATVAPSPVAMPDDSLRIARPVEKPSVPLDEQMLEYAADVERVIVQHFIRPVLSDAEVEKINANGWHKSEHFFDVTAAGVGRYSLGGPCVESYSKAIQQAIDNVNFGRTPSGKDADFRLRVTDSTLTVEWLRPGQVN